MTINLGEFEAMTSRAVQAFWESRDTAVERQLLAGIVDQGARSSVTSGKNMDGFVSLLADLIQENGLRNAGVYLTRGVNTLPGYFRPTKDWDLLVIHKSTLVAAIELKSQVGSFGNNFNNRTEEALGSAIDLWTAFREGAFGNQPRPFVGWLMHLQDAPASRKPTKTTSKHFPLFPDLQNASYVERYDELCRRLVLENLYTETALICSTEEGGMRGEFRNVSEENSLRRFAIAFSAHIAAAAAQ